MSYEALAACCRPSRNQIFGAVTDKATVKSVQAQLKMLAVGAGNPALDPGSVNGVLDSRTKSAVASFNRTYGWPEDGAAITAGTMEALQRPDVVRMTQAGAGGKVATVTVTDDEAVSARKDVVKKVEETQVEVKAALDAKMSAKTPEEMQRAIAQAKAAEAKADAVASEAQKASPEVRAAAEDVRAGAKLTSAATSPEQAKLAVARVEAAGSRVSAITRDHWVRIAAAAVAILGIGGTIALALKAKWLLAALTLLVLTPAAGAAVVVVAERQKT